MKRLTLAHKLVESDRIALYEDNETQLSFYVKPGVKEKKSHAHRVMGLDGTEHIIEKANNTPKGYDVICQDGLWTCNCADYYHRNNYKNSHLCKHILACIMWVGLERGKGQTGFEVI